MDKRLVGEYFSDINNLGHKLKPKFLKVEAMFQTPGKSIESAAFSKPANTMFEDLLKTFKARPFNIDCFSNFVVRYQNKDGEEEIFNLLRGKKEILKEIDLTKVTKRRNWYELIEADFDEFINELKQ